MMRRMSKPGTSEPSEGGHTITEQIIHLVDIDAVALIADDIKQEALRLRPPNIIRPRVVVLQPLDQFDDEVNVVVGLLLIALSTWEPSK